MIRQFLGLAMVVGAFAQQTPPRSVLPPAVIGTAIVAGRVLAGADGEVPVRRARVMLRSADPGIEPQTATTDDEGGFEFRGVPAGRFMVGVTKAGLLRASYGAALPNREGTSILVADAAQVLGLTIRMMRGAVITGTVRDARGRPVPGLVVSALRFGYSSIGERRLANAGSGDTDDRGIYRIWGVWPGEYVVMAPVVGLGSSPGHAPFQRLSIADVDRALGLSSSAGSLGAPAPRVSPQAVSRDPAVRASYAPVFHPGVTDPGLAAVITIVGEAERTAVDIVVVQVSTSTVEGIVRLPDGQPPAPMTVTLSGAGAVAGMLGPTRPFQPRSSRTGADGRFSFPDVGPGRYVVLAKTSPPALSGAAAQATDDRPLMWAREEISVADSALLVSLHLQPAMTISGRVVFEGPSAPPSDVTGLEIRLVPPGSGGSLDAGPQGGQLGPDGRFTFSGVTPGEYRMVQLLVRRWAGEWILKSAVANGRDTLDAPLIVTAGEQIEWTLTYSDRAASIAGTIQDTGSRPATEYFIVVFPVDERLWTPGSWRVRSTRPSTDGAYTVHGLPAGEYLVAVLTDLQAEDLHSTSILRALAPMAVRVAVSDGQAARQDLRIGR